MQKASSNDIILVVVHSSAVRCLHEEANGVRQFVLRPLVKFYDIVLITCDAVVCCALH